MFHNLFAKPKPYEIEHYSPCDNIKTAVRRLCNEVNNHSSHIRRLITANELQAGAIYKLERDLAAIHTAYREELCGCCCHVDVCKKKESIKYGDECEDMEFPCICNCPQEEESEDSQCCSNSGDGD